MMNLHCKRISFLIILFTTSLFFVALLSAFNGYALNLSRKKVQSERQLYITVTKKDRCVVCGMFVHPYQKWITQIQYTDDTHNSFDGMKCMCRALIDPVKYDVDKKKRTVKRVLVRDYYTLKFLKYDSAFYVIGSDVFGPMGHELIPFDTEKNAKNFMVDHNGLKIIRFDNINTELLDLLDNSKKSVVLK